MYFLHDNISMVWVLTLCNFAQNKKPVIPKTLSAKGFSYPASFFGGEFENDFYQGVNKSDIHSYLFWDFLLIINIGNINFEEDSDRSFMGKEGRSLLGKLGLGKAIALDPEL